MDSAVDIAFVQWLIAHGQSGALPPVGSESTEQQEWDKPSIAADVARLNSSLLGNITKLVCWQCRLLTAVTGFVHCQFPLVACAWMMKLSELRWNYVLEPNFVSSINVHGGAKVGPEGSHDLACRRSAGRTTRHHALNDLVYRALGHANIPAVKEPIRLLRSDGKRPDGLTQIPWQAGKCMTWDVTVTNTLAESYLYTPRRQSLEPQLRAPQTERN